MSLDPLLTLLGLASLATAADPATFAPTATRAGVRIQAAALPSTPGIGDLYFDSGDSNSFKWYTSLGYMKAVASSIYGVFITDPVTYNISPMALNITSVFSPSSGTIYSTRGLRIAATLDSTKSASFTTNTFFGIDDEPQFTIGGTDPDFSGASVYGIVAHPRVVIANSETNTFGTSVGVHIRGGANGSSTVTITDCISLLIDAYDDGSIATLTNRYAIKQNDAAAQNYFAGNTVFVPKALPTGVSGMVVVDSGGSYNKLSFYDGSAWLVVATGLGVPSAEGADRTLTNADNGKNLICTGSRTFTINTGLVAGFGCSFKGTVAFTGTATVTDVRTTGATNPWCALCATGVDTYDVVGSKA